jgi:hypothetical protein
MLESLGLSWRVYEAIEEEYADLSKPMNMKMTDKHSARNYVNRDYNALRVSMREAFLRGMARLKTTAEDRNRSCEAAWKDLDVPKFYFVSATEIYVGKEEIEAYKQKMGASFVEKPVKSTIVRKRISHSFMNSMIEKLKEEDYIRKTLVDNDPTLASEVESGTGLDYEPVNTEDPDDVPVNTEDPEEANLENMEDPEESQSDNIEEQEEVYLDEI